MRILITVVTNSRVSSIEMVGKDSYRAKVDARAMGGKANARLVEILSDHFGVRKSAIRIVKGLSGRNKVVDIDL